VPRLEALTPAPAVGFVTPLGSNSSGQTFRHLAVQATLLALRVYTVLPLTRIVPYVEFWAVETTRCFTLCVEAAAAPPVTVGNDESPPTARTATANRMAPRRLGIRPLCIVHSSRVSIRSTELRLTSSNGLPSGSVA
jgi:hypothetical protein